MKALLAFLRLDSVPAASLNTRFQKQIEDLYTAYFHDKIFTDAVTNDVEILHRITQLAAIKNDLSIPAYAQYLPTYQKEYGYPGLECTLASAILKLALLSAGYSNVHTLLLKGHQIVGRFTPKGVYLYDPSTQITRNNRLEGFSQFFPNKQLDFLIMKKEFGNRIMRIFSNEPIPYTEMFSKYNDQYQNIYYILPQHIHVHLTTIIENLKVYFRKTNKALSYECRQYLRQQEKRNPSIALKKETAKFKMRSESLSVSTDFPKIGAPALRALMQAGYTQLRDLTKVTEEELKQLHGMGPKALGILEEALQSQDLHYKSSK